MRTVTGRGWPGTREGGFPEWSGEDAAAQPLTARWETCAAKTNKKWPREPPWGPGLQTEWAALPLYRRGPQLGLFLDKLSRPQGWVVPKGRALAGRGAWALGHGFLKSQPPHKNRHRSLEQDRRSRNKATHSWSVNPRQRRQEHTLEKRVSSASRAGKSGPLSAEH